MQIIAQKFKILNIGNRKTFWSRQFGERRVACQVVQLQRVPRRRHLWRPADCVVVVVDASKGNISNVEFIRFHFSICRRRASRHHRQQSKHKKVRCKSIS